MDYDYRTRTGPPYNSQGSMYRPTTPPPSMYGSQPLYPRIAQPGQPAISPGARTSSQHHPTSSPSPSSGIGIRVAIKPEYRITPPPQMSSQIGEIPRCTLQFDFDFERKILAEAEKESQNWSRLGLENLPSRTAESSSSVGSVTDPIVSKYIASGLSREAVPLAVANYGDNPTKVKEFANGYNVLREMGFSSNKVAEALLMYDNDTEKALTHFLSGSS